MSANPHNISGNWFLDWALRIFWLYLLIRGLGWRRSVPKYAAVSVPKESALLARHFGPGPRM